MIYLLKIMQKVLEVMVALSVACGPRISMNGKLTQGFNLKIQSGHELNTVYAY